MQTRSYGVMLVLSYQSPMITKAFLTPFPHHQQKRSPLRTRLNQSWSTLLAAGSNEMDDLASLWNMEDDYEDAMFKIGDQSHASNGEEVDPFRETKRDDDRSEHDELHSPLMRKKSFENLKDDEGEGEGDDSYLTTFSENKAAVTSKGNVNEDELQSLWLEGESFDGIDDSEENNSLISALKEEDEIPSKPDKVNAPDQYGSGNKAIDTTSSSIATVSSFKPQSKRRKEATNIPVIKSPRGVGRQGYNLTLVHQYNYDFKTYHKHYQDEAWIIRLDLLRDYRNQLEDDEDLIVPFRYAVQVDDFDTNGDKNGEYTIHLGRWLHWIRTLYRKRSEEIDPVKANHILSEEHVRSLDKLGMNWKGVGVGRRPNVFRKRCKELEEFRSRFGHCNVPKDWEENRSLGLWVQKQKVLFRKKITGRESQLEEDRIEMLKDIGFDFGSIKIHGRKTQEELKKYNIIPTEERRIQDFMDNQWWTMFDALQGYKDLHGNCNVPLDYDRNEQLGFWVFEQKYHHHSLEGKESNTSTYLFDSSNRILNADRYQSLKMLDFNFTLSQSYPFPWTDIAAINFDSELMLRQFRKRILLDKCIEVDDSSSLLDSFVRRLRWEKQHEPTRLSDFQLKWLLKDNKTDVVGTMNDISSSWDDEDTSLEKIDLIQLENDWWENFHDLRRYNKENGDFMLEHHAPWYSEKLVNWLDEQKERYSSMIRSEHEDFPKQKRFLFERHYRALCDIGYKFCSTDPNQYHYGSKSPGRKPSILALENDLQVKYKKLPHDLKEILKNSEQKKSVDHSEQLAWLVRYESLRRYYSDLGPGCLSSAVRPDDVSGQRLALWASNQRKQYINFLGGKRSTMTKRRIQMLNEINFDWEAQNNDVEKQWATMVKELRRFKMKYGHCFVPAAYPRNKLFGQWVHEQRALYKISKSSGGYLPKRALTTEQIDELRDIGLDLTMDNMSYGQNAFETVRSAS